MRFSPAHTAARTPVYPGTESRTGLLQSVLLGQRPSLHALRQRSHPLVRTFRGYYAAARLLDHVHPGLICLRLSPDGPLSSADVTEVSLFSRMKFPGVPGVSDYAGLMISSRLRIPRYCLPSSPKWVGVLNLCFRSSIPCPPVPLSTLGVPPHDDPPKTRGQDGSLLLSCGALASPTTCRF